MSRRLSSEVHIGTTPLGASNPVRIQSMTNTSTMDTLASVEQCIRIIEAGADYVRLTAQGVREAENLRLIRDELRRRGYDTPLVADIHFNPAAAETAARYVEKVRINPGNFVKPVKTQGADYTDEEFALERDILKERFVAFLNICKQHQTAIRIGVNHGSLSERMMNRHGDTPTGMVESCLELLRICRDEDFADVVISLKASNTVMMVNAVRLLVDRMNAEGFRFPLHIGVTEAGDGEDGRIKSAVGIGALLAEGIGDTIRVSLSEAPENELPVAKRLVAISAECATALPPANPFSYHRRETTAFANIGGGNPPVVIAASGGDCTPDFVAAHSDDILLFTPSKGAFIDETREYFRRLDAEGCRKPVIIHYACRDADHDDFLLRASVELGSVILDGYGDGFIIDNPNIDPQTAANTLYAILQATRTRMSKTEYISCPSCGRTLFDLQTTIARVKAATQHLRGLKIAIMGCIVNGPGEMADADYGYVGAGKGRVSLYKRRECILKNIPEEEAVEQLVKLIRDCGDFAICQN